MGLGIAIATGWGNMVRAYRNASANASDLMLSAYPEWIRQRGVKADRRQVADQDRYATADDVFAAVGLIADLAASVPLVAQVNGEPDPEHPLTVLLERWNRWYGGQDSRFRAYATCALMGEVFLLIDRTNQVDPLLPNQLWPIGGQNLRVYPGTKPGEMVGWYEYERGGDSERLNVADVVPITTWNPRDPLRGLSPLSSLRIQLDSELSAKRTNRDIFSNGLGADAVMAIEGTAAAGGMSGAIFSQIRAEMERFKAEGWHGVLPIPGSVTVAPLRLTPADAQFLELDKITTRDVAKAYRVPPEWLADHEHATYSNMGDATKGLWRFGVAPWVRRFAEKLTVHLGPQYDGDVEVKPDWSGIAEMAEDERPAAEIAGLKAETAGKLVRAGFERLWVGNFVYGEGAVPPEAVAEDFYPVVLAPIDGPVQAPPPRAIAVPRVKAVTGRERELYAQLVAGQDALRPAVASQVNAALGRECDKALAAYERVVAHREAARGLRRKGAADALVATLMGAIEVDTSLEEAILRVLHDGVNGGAARTVSTFGLSIDPGRVTQATREWVRSTAAGEVRLVHDETRRLLREGIGTALDAGEGIVGVRERIRIAFLGSPDPLAVDAYRGRVENIAQTELGAAYNHGADECQRKAGAISRTWLSSHLPDSRHGGVDGQVRSFEEPFDVRGFPGRYPGDPNLPAGERCRCKCCAVPQFKE